MSEYTLYLCRLRGPERLSAIVGELKVQGTSPSDAAIDARCFRRGQGCYSASF